MKHLDSESEGMVDNTPISPSRKSGCLQTSTVKSIEAVKDNTSSRQQPRKVLRTGVGKHFWLILKVKLKKLRSTK